MRVIVTGGTGFIGSSLCRRLQGAGHEPVVFSRDPARARALLPGIQAQLWQPDQPGSWRGALQSADAVINLAGESIAGKRWSAQQKATLRSSRVDSTRVLVEAMAESSRQPAVLLNASATGFYGPRGDEPVTESDSPGDDFLGGLCQEWESAAVAAEKLGVRVVLMRTGVVLGKGSRALTLMALPFRMFVGGPVGNGRQGFPWVHLDDVVGLYVWALENEAVSGPLNAVGPEPLTNRELSQRLGRVLGRPSWVPVPAAVLKLALGEMSDILLAGQKVLPARAQASGYEFKFRTAEQALREALK